MSGVAAMGARRTMKALRKIRQGKGLALEQIPIPTAGPAEAVVRVKLASICGTDLHIYDWDLWSQRRVRPPVTLGHEFCGTVECVGDDVTAVGRGDFVSGEMHVPCGYCHQCRLGEAHICRNLGIIGIDRDGAFAEYVKIPASNLWKLEAGFPESYAAILDPLGNAVHAALAGPIVGQTVLITGCGPIGLMSIAVAKACGCSTVFAAETNTHRRELARRLGADMVLHANEGSVARRVRSETEGTGVDVLLEMSGNPEAIRQGFGALRSGGRASLLGIPAEPVVLDLVNDVIFKGATVEGIYGRRMYETWMQMSALVKGGRLSLDPIFGERLPLERFAEAFELLASGIVAKVLMYPNGLRG